MSDGTNPPGQMPDTANTFADDYPDVWEAYTDLGRAAAESGPIDGETKRLVKLAMAVADGSEGAVHSHTRRGLEEDIPPEKLEQVAVLSIPTIGFPNAMAAKTWIQDLTRE